MTFKQYVVFELEKNEFGIEISRVKEIIPYEDTTNIPNCPSFIEGVLNYRNNVIPIINLRERFNIQGEDKNDDKRIIVINLDDREIGFVVDQASQTLRLDENDIDPVPEVIPDINRRYLTGVGKIDEKRLLLLLNLHNVLTDDEKKEVLEMEIEV